MNRSAILLFAGCLAIFTSCKKGESQPTDSTAITTTDTVTVPAETSEKPDVAIGTFDINTVPVSTTELGDFPYFKLPNGYTFTDPDHAHNGKGKGLTTDYDKEYFLSNGYYVPQEGKTFKGHIRLADNAKDKTYSALELQKSFDDLISKMGGVKTNNGTARKSGERDRILATDPDAQSNGYISTTMYFDNIHTYVIRKPDYAIWVQYSLNNENGYIAVLKTAAFENKMTLLSSSQIKKDLDEKGKAVLYINFDTDKATLKSDGEKAVAEIVKALQSDKALKIGINGYTDNVGSEPHNLELSKARATTVLNTLTKSGIDKSRLSADGFGSKNPIAPNTSEDGKAKNRRVELLKK